MDSSIDELLNGIKELAALVETLEKAKEREEEYEADLPGSYWRYDYIDGNRFSLYILCTVMNDKYSLINLVSGHHWASPTSSPGGVFNVSKNKFTRISKKEVSKLIQKAIA